MSKKRKQGRKANGPTKQDSLILAAIIIAVFAVIAVVNINSNHESPALNAKVKLQHNEAELVSAALDLYYINNGGYPASLDSALVGEPQKSAAKDLKQLDYTVTGDGKAYRFTYVDNKAARQTVNGNYEKDLH